MKDFLFVFRADFNGAPKGSPEEMQATTKKWMDWVGSLGARNKLVDRGNSLSGEGKVVRAGNLITDGPYTELKELIGGYTIVKADSLEEATRLAEGCPVFAINGCVEVREINHM